MSTANDLAALGTVVMDADGSSFVPAYYLERMVAPGSSENPAWGFCWWNNAQSHYKVPMREEKTRQGPVMPGAPADTIAARGALENGLYVIPSRKLVIARTSLRESKPGFEQRLFELLGPWLNVKEGESAWN